MHKVLYLFNLLEVYKNCYNLTIFKLLQSPQLGIAAEFFKPSATPAHTRRPFFFVFSLQVRTYDVAGAPADVHNNLSTFRNIPTLGELPGKDLNPLNSSNSNIFANFVGKKKKEDEAKAAAAAFFRDVYPTFKKMRLVASVPLPSTVTSFDEENAVVPDTPPRLKQRVKRRALADRLRQANSNSNDNLGVTAAPTYVASTVVKCLNFSAFPVHDDKNLAPAVAAPTAASNRLSGKKRCTAGDPTGPPVAKRVCLRDVDFNFSISSTTPKNTFTAMDIDDEEEKVLPVPAPTPATAATNNRPAPQKAASRKKTHAPNKTNTSSSKPESKKKVGKPVVKKTTQGGAKIVNPAKSTINNAWSGRLRARKATPS